MISTLPIPRSPISPFFAISPFFICPFPQGPISPLPSYPVLHKFSPSHLPLSQGPIIPLLIAPILPSPKSPYSILLNLSPPQLPRSPQSLLPQTPFSDQPVLHSFSPFHLPFPQSPFTAPLSSHLPVLHYLSPPHLHRSQILPFFKMYPLRIPQSLPHPSSPSQHSL